jgi:hypothetical protein
MAKKGARTDCVRRFSKLSPKCAEQLGSASASFSRGQMGDLPPAFARNFSGPNAAFAPLFAPSICSLTFFGAFFSFRCARGELAVVSARNAHVSKLQTHAMRRAPCTNQRSTSCAQLAYAATRRAHASCAVRTQSLHRAAVTATAARGTSRCISARRAARASHVCQASRCGEINVTPACNKRRHSVAAEYHARASARTSRPDNHAVKKRSAATPRLPAGRAAGERAKSFYSLRQGDAWVTPCTIASLSA